MESAPESTSGLGLGAPEANIGYNCRRAGRRTVLILRAGGGATWPLGDQRFHFNRHDAETLYSLLVAVSNPGPIHRTYVFTLLASEQRSASIITA